MKSFLLDTAIAIAVAIVLTIAGGIAFTLRANEAQEKNAVGTVSCQQQPQPSKMLVDALTFTVQSKIDYKALETVAGASNDERNVKARELAYSIGETVAAVVEPVVEYPVQVPAWQAAERQIDPLMAMTRSFDQRRKAIAQDTTGMGFFDTKQSGPLRRILLLGAGFETGKVLSSIIETVVTETLMACR
jgi:hypothetical protein